VLTVKPLSFGFRRNRGEIAEVVVFAAVGDGVQILSVTAVSNTDTSDTGSYFVEATMRFAFGCDCSSLIYED
jgi:hypothetical protein